ncbi:MAG: HEAT repeat domain-containing protein [Deltaproteobacteria bacterium]|nr:HEAT repeat domain-containing protein [Deltaproteobacteria bacterium]
MIASSLALLACGGAREEPPATAHAPAAASPAIPEATSTTTAAPARDLAPEITRLKDRQQCNRVTGCPPLTALLSAGGAAVEPLARALAESPGADAYWVVAALDGLGQLGDARALPTLIAHAEDRRWEVQIAALRALGRLAPHLDAASRLALVTDLKPGLTAPNVDVARLAARHVALARLDAEAGEGYRKGLLALAPTPERAAVLAVPAPFLDVLVELAGELRLTEALPFIRIAALSDNRFVSVHAAEVLGRLRDTGAVPFLLERIEDPHPTIRRTALEALAQITGSRFDTPAAWRAWAAQHGLDALPASARDQGKGGSSEPTGTGQGPADP